MVWFDPINEILAFEKKFKDLFSPFIEFMPEKVYPPVNLYSTDSEILAVIRIPGVNPQDIEISVNDNLLTIKGCRSEKNEKTAKQESYCGKFDRTIELPVKVDSENVKAEMTDGILKVIFPKSKELVPRKIEIKTV